MGKEESFRAGLSKSLKYGLAIGSHEQIKDDRQKPYFNELFEILKTRFASTYIERFLQAIQIEDSEKSQKEVRAIASELEKRISDNPSELLKIYDNSRNYVNDSDIHFVVSKFRLDRDIIFNIEAAIKFAIGVSLVGASQNLYPKGYILGVKDDEIIGRKIRLLDSNFQNIPSHDELMDLAKQWTGIACHFPYFIKADIDALDNLVMDFEPWEGYHTGDTLPKSRQGYDIGKQLFDFGLKEKVYASDRPHKILLDGKHLESMTLIDTFNNGVIFKTRSGDKKISVGEMALFGNDFLFSTSTFSPYSNIFNLRSQFLQEGFLCGLCGAITRDMFICEKKMKFYSEVVKRGKNNHRSTSKTIIWLPRTKIDYFGIADSERGNVDDLSSKVYEVAPCDVTGHIRKCKNPNEIQLSLAEQHGINIPEGYTYVKPHKRGAHSITTREYKSRSALAYLFSSSINPNQSPHN